MITFIEPKQFRIDAKTATLTHHSSVMALPNFVVATLMYLFMFGLESSALFRGIQSSKLKI